MPRSFTIIAFAASTILCGSACNVRDDAVSADAEIAGEDGGGGGSTPLAGDSGLSGEVADGHPVIAGLDADAGDAGTNLPDSAVTSALPLCHRTGGAEIRFAARIAGGGPIPPGTSMLIENGWQFLLVDDSCRAWILPGDHDALVQLTLSPTQEARLTEALKLGAWSAIAPPAGGCTDATETSFRLDQERLSGSSCGAPPGSAWSTLNAALQTQLGALGAAGTPLAGDVRYLLVEDDGSSKNVDSRAPVLWPLSAPAPTVAISAAALFQYRAGDSRLATASDAAALRVIRTSSQNGTLAGGAGTVFDYSPVTDPQGILYRLFIRDEVPSAGPGGIFPAGMF
jgi:hypothetical protein